MLYSVTTSDLFQLMPQRDFAKESYELQLEEWIVKNPSILTEGENILFIKREKPLEKSEDLLGLDGDGNTIIVELKRGRTPREVVAQALEYAARIKPMIYEDLNRIAKKYFKDVNISYESIHEAFCSNFGIINPNELIRKVNKRQKIIIVAQDISEDVLLMADYLRSFGIDIRCISFRYYKEGELVIVDMDLDVRGSWEETKVTQSIRTDSNTQLFLTRLREHVLDQCNREIVYATQKPNRVLAIMLEPESRISVKVLLEGDELQVGASLQFNDQEKNEEVIKRLYNILAVELTEKSGGTSRWVYEVLRWDSTAFDDEDYIHCISKRVVEWIEALSTSLS